MTIKLSVPSEAPSLDLRPRIVVIGVGGAGGNAVNNMIRSQLDGVEFVVANTDAQALTESRAQRRLQLGVTITQGLGAGSRPEIGRIAAEEALEDIVEEIRGANMAFIAAGMGGGTGTGAAPVIARAAREQGILTVGVVTKPFHFEGGHRMRIAELGIEELEQFVDTLIIIPNQNLFRVANEKTTFADAFKMADDVLYAGVRGVTDLMVMPGLINLDFADIRAVMSEMGKAMMGTGEAEGERRALMAAEAAISNPLLDDASMKGARGVLINITGGSDMTLFEVDEAANRIRSEVDPDAFIIFGSTYDDDLNGKMRVSVVATGMDIAAEQAAPTLLNLAEGEPRRPHPLKAPSAASTHVAAAALNRHADTRVEQPTPHIVAAPPDRESEDAGTASGPHEAFIPPVPAESAADATGASGRVAHTGNGRPGEPDVRTLRPRVSGLLARVTGAGRSQRPAKIEPTIEPALERQAPAERPRRVGAANPEDRLPTSQSSEDLLEIPAFLRRQAN